MTVPITLFLAMRQHLLVCLISLCLSSLALANSPTSNKAFHPKNAPEWSAVKHYLKTTSPSALREDLVKAWREAAPTLFTAKKAKIDLFFADYPVQINPAAFFEKHWQTIAPIIARWPLEDLSNYTGLYGEALSPAMKQHLANLHYEAIAGSKPPSDRRAQITAYLKGRAAGLPNPEGAPLKIAFVQLTSKVLLKKRAIEFPVDVALDLPVTPHKLDINQALGTKDLQEADLVVMLEVAQAKVHRDLPESQDYSSEFIMGYQRVPNPDYDRLQREIMALNRVHASEQASMASLFGALGTNLIGAGQNKQIATAEEALAATPRIIDQPQFAKYQYSVVEVESLKTAQIRYYVIDRQAGLIFEDTFDLSQEAFFQVPYKVHPSDPKREGIKRAYNTEKEVSDFEKAPILVELSSLLDQFLAGQSKPLPSIDSFYVDLMEKHNRAITAMLEEKHQGTFQRGDLRFESTVKVFHSSSFGTGFYVAPDIIITNYHVVKEQQFVELEKYNKQETFGKVIAKDLRLDLALIKVQERGRPVSFWPDREIPLGSTVEAIGHPRGFDFSITRGIVSAIRPMQTITSPSKKKVLQIQTDAATSPGNSGGPVFLGDHLIGIVSWGRVDQGSENLNFLIHHKEAQDFLKRNNIDYWKG